MIPYEPGHFDRLRAKHPFPGGWRADTRDTELERTALGRNGWTQGYYARADVPDERTLIDQCHFDHGVPKTPETFRSIGEIYEEDGRLFASRGWITRNLTVGWYPSGLSSYLGSRPINARRVHARLTMYDVADVLRELVASKPRIRSKIGPSVIRLLQGSGSINDKLLAFVEKSAE